MSSAAINPKVQEYLEIIAKSNHYLGAEVYVRDLIGKVKRCLPIWPEIIENALKNTVERIQVNNHVDDLVQKTKTLYESIKTIAAEHKGQPISPQLIEARKEVISKWTASIENMNNVLELIKKYNENRPTWVNCIVARDDEMKQVLDMLRPMRLSGEKATLEKIADFQKRRDRQVARLATNEKAMAASS